jgi:molybdopterin biosynthesis enzyme
MSNLMDTYQNMQKSAEEAAAADSLEKEAHEVTSARVEVLANYAETANDVLAEEYGEDYTEGDVVKLATYLIDRDIDEEENVEKVAEYIEAGQIMARSFVEELSNSEEEAK